jgi:hypothetical protein
MITKNKSKQGSVYDSFFTFTIMFLVIYLSSAINIIAFGQDNQIPNGWIFNFNQSDFKAAPDSNISYHGKVSTRLESAVDNPPDFCTLMQTAVVKDYSGKRVKMTGYIKSQGQNVTGSMWLRVDDIGNKIYGDFDNMMDRPVTGNKDWTKCEIIFDVPEKCVLYFGFILTGTGKIWVDNVSFETVSITETKTAQKLDQPFPEGYLDQIKDQAAALPDKPPVNLDFEDNLSNHQ